MWSTRKGGSGSRLGHDTAGHSYIRHCLTFLKFGKPTTKQLKNHYNRHKRIVFWVYRIKKAFVNKEEKVDFRFVERNFLAAINLTESAEGALTPVLLRITHWTKSGLPVSPPGLFTS